MFSVRQLSLPCAENAHFADARFRLSARQPRRGSIGDVVLEPGLRAGPIPVELRAGPKRCRLGRASGSH
jgi:hypothetical protein